MKKEQKKPTLEINEQNTKEVSKAIPDFLIPSGKMVAEIFGLLIIVVILWGVLGTNISNVGSSASLGVEIGWPWSFFYLAEDYSDRLPIDILNLILDMVVYLVISYILAVVVSVIVEGFKKKPVPGRYEERNRKIVKNLKRVGGLGEGNP